MLYIKNIVFFPSFLFKMNRFDILTLFLKKKNSFKWNIACEIQNNILFVLHVFKLNRLPKKIDIPHVTISKAFHS